MGREADPLKSPTYFKERRKRNKALKKSKTKKFDKADAQESFHVARTAVLPPDLVYPTPLITQWVRWINGRNHRPQPEIALAGVLAAMSGIIGRNLTWQGHSSNIYALGLAMSGSGKDACKKGVHEVMEAIGCKDRISNSALTDERTFYNQLMENRELVLVSDEFHEFMRKIRTKSGSNSYMHPNAGPIVSMLLEAFSGNVTGLPNKGSTSPDIENPHLSLFAMCQPEAFWNLCQASAVENGFLGRFIIFNGRLMPAITHPNRDPPPSDMLDMLRSGFTRAPGLTEIEADDDCIDLHYKLSAEFDKEFTQKSAYLDRNPLKSSLHSRAMEKASRLALIHAWSLCPSKPVMTKESIQWGHDLMFHCNKFTLAGISGKLEDMRIPITEAKVISFMRLQGDAGSLRADILAVMDNLPESMKRFVLVDMVRAGKVAAIWQSFDIMHPTGIEYKGRVMRYWLGPRSIDYSLPGFRPSEVEERYHYERQKNAPEAKASES